MVFDANLVLVDGSVNWTYANIVTAGYGTPTSTTRNSGGFATLDLMALGGTPAMGVAIVLIIPTGAGSTDALTLLAQSSDSATFASGVHNLAGFDLAAATSGIILGSESPCTVIRRVATVDRYLRVYAVVTTGDDFGATQVLVNPWAFGRL